MQKSGVKLQQKWTWKSSLPGWLATNIDRYRLKNNWESRSGWLNCKNILTIRSFSYSFRCKYFRYLDMKRFKPQSHATLKNAFAFAVLNLLQEKYVMLPVWFEQTKIWWMEISTTANLRTSRSAGSFPEQRMVVETNSWSLETSISTDQGFYIQDILLPPPKIGSLCQVNIKRLKTEQAILLSSQWWFLWVGPRRGAFSVSYPGLLAKLVNK